MQTAAASMLEQVGPEISAPVWTGKELAGLAGDPLGEQTHPFARSRIDEGQPFGKMVGKLQEIAAPDAFDPNRTGWGCAEHRCSVHLLQILTCSAIWSAAPKSASCP
jgi:hypothetical protein